MRTTIIAAALLLLAQLTLAVFMNMGGNKNIAATPESAFLAITPPAVSSLEIIGTGGTKLVMEKRDGGWVLPETFDAPVASETITGLLDKLAGLKKGFVVAASAEAAKRFKVADDTFERHILIKEKDKTVADFYIGTSPGFREAHARRAGDNDIVAIGLSTYELESQAEKWLDTEILQLSRDNIAGIVYADFSLEKKKGDGKTADTWRFTDDGNTAPDSSQVTELVNKIAELRIITALDPKTAGTGSDAGAEFRFTVKQPDGKALDYTFSKIDDNFFAVKRSDKNLTGKVGKAVVEELQQFNRDVLTGVKPEPAVSAQQGDSQPMPLVQPVQPTGPEIALPEHGPAATAGSEKVPAQN